METEIIQILIAKTNNSIDSTVLRNMLSLLPYDLQIKANQFKFEKDMNKYIIGKLLVRRALNISKIFGNVLQELEYNEYGKPYIPRVNFNFNISHSRDYVILAFAKNGDIGIDIEFVAKININDFQQILNRKDIEYLQYSEDKESDFFKLWTSKESVIKAAGDSVAYAQNIFIDFEKCRAIYKKKIWYLNEIKYLNNYKIHLCTTNRNISIVINEILFSELF